MSSHTTDPIDNFYFHGELIAELPHHWSLISVDYAEDWIGYLCWLIHCRIDHVGVIESESSDIMEVFINHHLCTLINQSGDIRKDLATRYSSERADDIIKTITSELILMGTITQANSKVAWTNGSGTDLRALQDFLASPPDIFPHEKDRDRDIQSARDSSMKDLRVLANTSKTTKEFRSYIYG